MKWIKITADNFIELQLGDKVTKENSVELANLFNSESVAENNSASAGVYKIKDASVAPEKTVQLECFAKGEPLLEVSNDELIENWWWLVK